MSRGSLWVVLALVLALASALTALVGRGQDSSRILVASQPLAAGRDVESALADGDAVFRDVAGVSQLAGLIGAETDVRGKHLSAPVQSGEPITAAALGGLGLRLPTVAPGERLLSIPLSAAGAVAGSVGPGVEVDVVASAVQRSGTTARVVAERAEVVAVDDRVEALERGSGGVLIRASADEALALTEALATGADLRLIVRPRQP